MLIDYRMAELSRHFISRFDGTPPSVARWQDEPCTAQDQVGSGLAHFFDIGVSPVHQGDQIFSLGRSHRRTRKRGSVERAKGNLVAYRPQSSC